MSFILPDPTDLRRRHTYAVLDALAAVLDIDPSERGADAALARAIGVAPQQVTKARSGGRTTEWLARIAAAHRIEVVQHGDGTVTATVPE